MAKAKVTIKWEGLAELKKTLEACGIALDDKSNEVKEIILPPAQAAVENARNLAPMGHDKAAGHVPGTLKRSLIATKGPATQRGIFMVARKKIAPYASYVEYGTSKMSAQPFFRPALLQFASTYVADVAPGIKKLVEDTCAKNAYHPPG